MLTAFFVSDFVYYAFPNSSWFGLFALVAILFIIFLSPNLEKDSKKMVKNFTDNLSAREKMMEEG